MNPLDQLAIARVIELESADTDAQRQQLQAQLQPWLQASPAHLEAFQRAERWARMLDGICALLEARGAARQDAEAQLMYTVESRFGAGSWQRFRGALDLIEKKLARTRQNPDVANTAGAH